VGRARDEHGEGEKDVVSDLAARGRREFPAEGMISQISL
jgi:hypothetical protein